MALKTEKKAEVPDEPVPTTTVLELALYKVYTWGLNTYEQGKPYRFKNSDAMVLLAEQDTGRPVWKLYRKPVPKQAPKTEVVDATMVHAPVPVEEFVLKANGTVGPKRIEIGDDSEIADILPVDSSDNVTV